MYLFDERGAGDHNAKINVYTKDFSNETEVRAAEKAIVEHLRDSGIQLRKIVMMKYKAELYTHVNIFANNRYNGVGIPPSLYTSIHVGRDKDGLRGFRGNRDGATSWRGRGRGAVRGQLWYRS